MAGHVKGYDHAGQELDGLGFDFPAIKLFQPCKEGGAQLGWFVGVTEDAVFDPRLQGLDHGFGGTEVHVGHIHRQDIWRICIPFGTFSGAAVNEGVEVKGHREEGGGMRDEG
jgi:hypothetical protein